MGLMSEIIITGALAQQLATLAQQQRCSPEEIIQRALNHAPQPETEPRRGRLFDVSEYEAKIGETLEVLHQQTLLREQFAHILDATIDMVAICNADLRLTYLNPAGQRLTNRTDYSGIDIRTLYPRWAHPIIFGEGIEQARLHGTWSGEVALLQNEQYETPVSLVIVALGAADSAPAFGMLARDITEAKVAENTIIDLFTKERELHELTRNFISLMSHELRVPLTSIFNAVQFLTRFVNRIDSEKSQGYLKRIEGDVKQLNRMLDLVIMISRAETVGLKLKPEIIHTTDYVNQLITHIYDSAPASHRINVSIEAAEQFLADRYLLDHALTNLLMNAIKYSPTADHVDFVVSSDQQMIKFTVRDYGIGIPGSDHENLFKMFKRGSNVGSIDGTGLGLVLVYHVITAHGGSIHIHSEVNEGTTFEVLLPIHSS